MRTWIGQLIQDYYYVDGQPLGERNPKWLQDDYVKFLRFGQWRIEKTGHGILAYITNHGYLDNPTFRGMRQQLLRSFTDVYVLDLHGNTRKKERSPDGGPDKNVFDIEQGVAIGVFVKEPGEAAPAKASHAELWGEREAKYGWLAEHDVLTTESKAIAPDIPAYLFVPQHPDLRAEYDGGWTVTEVFPINSVGIVTARDSLTIRWSKEEMLAIVRDFVALEPEPARTKYRLGNDVRDWKVQLAQQDVRSSGPEPGRIAPILYRPFDVRFTYYTGRTRGFICMPRPEAMRHLLAGRNFGLLTTRQTRDQWDALVTTTISGHKSLSAESAYDITSLLPLYLYPTTEGQPGAQASMAGLSPWPKGRGGRRPNLNAEFVAEIGKRLGLTFVPDGRGDLTGTFGPEDVFHYIYAVLHSPTYRARYAEFLKTDFPRIPLTSDRELFAALSAKGADLAALHLMESPALGTLITTFPVPGTNVVEKVRYDEGNRRVYINTQQYFEGIPPEVWSFQVGGYQVCDKWLKDRRGRKLTHDDTQHYQRIVVALAATMRLMRDIEGVIANYGGWPLR